MAAFEDTSPPAAVGGLRSWWRRASPWITIAILTAFYILSFVDRQLFNLLSQSIQKSIGLSDVQLSLLQGFAFSLFYGLVGLPLGWAVDRFSRAWILFGGVILWSLSSMGCGLSGSFAGVFASRAGVGFGEASLSPSAYSILGSLFERKRLAFASSVFGIGANIGGGLALAFGGLLVAYIGRLGVIELPVVRHLEPWQVAFLLTGVPGFLLAGLAFAIREPARTTTGAQRGAESSWAGFFAFVWSERALLARHFASFPLVAMVIYGVGAWTPPYLMRRFHIPLQDVGYILALATGVFGLAGNLIAGQLADRLMRRGRYDACYRIPMYATLLSFPFGLLAFLAPSAILAAIGISLFSLLSNSFAGTAAASLNLITPEPFRGKAFSCYWLWMSVMGGLGPLFAALLSQDVFHDKLMIGASVAVVMAVTLPVAVLAFASNLRGLHRINRALAEREEGGQAPA